MSWLYLTGTLRKAVPYALSSFFRQLSTRIDIIFLGFFLDAAATGIYSVAYRIVFLFLFLPYLAGVTLFPLASRLYVSSRTELEALYHNSLNVSILIGLPTACGLWLIAPALINLSFGETFAESALLLRYLVWLLFLACLKNIMGSFLMACDRQIERARSQWMVAWVNVLGNGLLIPAFGIKGAAIAALISESFLVFLFAMRLRAVIGWPRIGSRFAMSSMATSAFCLPLAFFSSLSLWVMLPVSVLLYFGTLVSFKEIRRNEVRTLVNFW